MEDENNSDHLIKNNLANTKDKMAYDLYSMYQFQWICIYIYIYIYISGIIIALVMEMLFYFDGLKPSITLYL